MNTKKWIVYQPEKTIKDKVSVRLVLGSKLDYTLYFSSTFPLEDKGIASVYANPISLFRFYRVSIRSSHPRSVERTFSSSNFICLRRRPLPWLRRNAQLRIGILPAIEIPCFDGFRRAPSFQKEYQVKKLGAGLHTAGRKLIDSTSFFSLKISLENNGITQPSQDKDQEVKEGSTKPSPTSPSIRRSSWIFPYRTPIQCCE
jgi:hypothetical protein